MKHGKIICIILIAACVALAACARPETPDSSTTSGNEAAKAASSESLPSKSASSKSMPDANAHDDAKKAALEALEANMGEQRASVYVYKDFGMAENHFTQKAKMWGVDESLVKDMDENCQTDPYAGSSCIKCEQDTRSGDWGGWLFLNGYLPKGETTPKLNDGSTGGQGLNLTGAAELRFAAKGERGGETVNFFAAGFGYDGETGERTAEWPDSAKKQDLGWVELTDEWKEYSIPLGTADMSSIVCGFGYALNDKYSTGSNTVFYLDEIRFTGSIQSALEAPVMLRSYDTDNAYIRNAAYSYDNALVALAFISEGKQDEAKQLVDAFVYAVNNDRSSKKRVRNAYAAGDISAFPGWESGARLPGWYDADDGEWYEDRYQVGSNVGNTSYIALALLQYYAKYGGDEYRDTACALMDWVMENCPDTTGNGGFTGGFDGWEESSDAATYPFTYKSIEHNIDAFAVFNALYAATADEKYHDAAKSAEKLIASLYDDKQGLFMTGTLDDGVTPNTSVVALDAQVWSAMALGDAFGKYEASLKTVESMKTDEGGYPFCQENKNGGWWAEGTAYTALMYRMRGDMARYDEAMSALEGIQLDSGLFPAATVDDLSTGMELFDGTPWEYSKDPHIAPTAWFVMAANGFNPYAF